MTGCRPAPRHLVLQLSLALCVASLSGCSHVDHRWQWSGYSAQSPAAIKRLAVRGLADHAWAPGLAETLGTVASDYAKLRRNYIVAAADEQAAPPAGEGVGAGVCPTACVPPQEGVLILQALDARRQGDALELTLRAELWACAGRRPIWSAQGHQRLRANDARLQALTASYTAALGPDAAAWAAAAFVLGQQVLDGLPDPVLSPADIEEKIEAG